MFTAIRQHARSLLQGQRLARSLTTESNHAATSSSTHALNNRPIPKPTERYSNPAAFLKSVGRESDKKLKAENLSWEQLWQLDGLRMKKEGVSVQDRRYILWAMEKFRQGDDPIYFAREPKGKKKVRGRGPAVQNGKRIRSRRKQ